MHSYYKSNRNKYGVLLFTQIYQFVAGEIGGRNVGGGGGKKGMGTGKETLRLRSKGPATVEIVSNEPVRTLVVTIISIIGTSHTDITEYIYFQV